MPSCVGREYGGGAQSSPAAPFRAAVVARRVAASVAGAPHPAMTGTRAASTATATTRACSAAERAGASPVLPQTTSAAVPALACRSHSAASAPSSTRPSRNGVTSATAEPPVHPRLPWR